MGIFPEIEKPEELPIDGSVFRIPDLCKKKFGEKCTSYYNSIADKPGVHHCPFGFSSYVESEKKIITGVIFKDQKNTKLGSRNFEDGDFTAHLSTRELMFQVSKERGESHKLVFEKPAIEITNTVEIKESKENDAREFNLPIEILDNTIHELRKLNNSLKIASRTLRNESQERYSNINTIRDKAHIVYSTSSLISIRLDTYDFLTNPGLATGFNPTPIKIYKKFEKSMHILRHQAMQNGIEISFNGHSSNVLYGYTIFEILPFILFENAIKYSTHDSEIICTFKEDDTYKTVVTIHNIGSVPEKEERESLVERGYRGKKIKGELKGSGIGLYIVNEICKIHNTDLDINYSLPFDENDAKRIGNFYVNLIIHCN